MTTECEHCVDGVCQQTKGWCPPKAPRTIMHDPRCKFLRPDGIACTCGSFEREIAAAKLPRTATTTTEEPAMPADDDYADGYACPHDNHAIHCRCHTGAPIMVDIPPAVGKSERQLLTETTSQRGRGICDHAASLIDGDRNASYGDAEVNFTETAALWSPVLGTDVTAEQVAICMTLVKIGRLIQTPNHADSWIDAVGYMALGGGIASKPGRYV